MLHPEVQDAASRSVLCWLATVGADGQPNVSPKEIFAVFDEAHLVIANVASPGSVRNIAVNPHVGLLFIQLGEAPRRPSRSKPSGCGRRS